MSPTRFVTSIITDTAITERQKQVLLDIYTSFCEQNEAVLVQKTGRGRGADDLTNQTTLIDRTTK